MNSPGGIEKFREDKKEAEAVGRSASGKSLFPVGAN